MISRRSRANAVLFCRATQQALLRLLTNSAVLAPYGNSPLTNAEAWAAYEAFAADDRVTLAGEPKHLEPQWRQFAARDTSSPKLLMDAYLAAFAIAAGARLVTTDAAFRQFAGLDLLVLGPAGGADPSPGRAGGCFLFRELAPAHGEGPVRLPRPGPPVFHAKSGVLSKSPSGGGPRSSTTTGSVSPMTAGWC